MTIKEVSEKYNISADTLRYYERVGAIPPVTRTAAGTRDYQKADIEWVKLAMCLRAAGCSIDALVKYRELNEMGNAASFIMIGPSTKITNLGALKIVLGVKHFAMYIAFVIVFAIVSGAVVNLII